MHQFGFSVTTPTGARHTVYCTAPKAEWARLQLQAKYPGWPLSDRPTETHPPHRVYAEIDAADMTQADAAWLARRIAEGAAA